MTETLRFDTIDEAGAETKSPGTIEYSVVGAFNPDRNRIIFVGGIGNDFTNVSEVADMLADQGSTQVLTTGQPKYDAEVSRLLKIDPDQALDFLASATINSAREAGFFEDDKPVNLIGHSLGGLVLNRIREIAKRNEIQSLLPQNGSLAVYAASSGTDPNERVSKVFGRLPRYMAKGTTEAKFMDPEGAKGKAVRGHLLESISKSIGELRAIGSRTIDPDQPGAIAIIYPDDRMFPENKRALRDKGFVADIVENERTMPVLTPIDPDDKIIASLRGSKSELGARRGDIRKTHLKAGHDEPSNNPQRTVNVILDFFRKPGDYLGSR